MKKIIIALIGIIALSVVANFLIPSISSAKDFKHINYTEAFDQKESEYFVYFYQDSCGLCQQFSPELVSHYSENKTPIYVVDLGAEENLDAWYDWEAHNEAYTKVIGRVKGEEKIYNEGESAAKYPTNEGWKIYANDKDELIAYKETAENNQAPQNAEELDVAGTPALLKIKNGEFAGYTEGLDKSRQLLATYGQE